MLHGAAVAANSFLESESVVEEANHEPSVCHKFLAATMPQGP